ncbi:MAG: PmoA family protein [Cyclobacteriaceae bacterium]|nr:PmoA family protein [Cyclobacteriaceae bacterium]
MRVKLNKHQKVALSENRLMIAFRRKEQYVYLPVQALGKADDPYQYLLVDVFPVDFFEENATWHICETPEIFKVVAKMDSDSGQIVISEEDDIVLHYNYLQIFEKDVYRSELEKEQLKDLPGLESVRLKNQRYAVPRSNYIHPLFDLAGNLLTRDWPHDHPHHRGIYWAWPEVMYGNEMADLHALQDIYARPNGNFHFESGLLFAELIAENLWYWKDEKPLVKENACIRIHKKRNNYRIIDLELTFTPLLDSISIATRNQNSYGGLNIRLSEPQAQCIHYFMGEEQDLPLRAWSVLHGFFGGQTDESSGLIILQSRKNPDYPGAWVLYPELSWVQPTFPANDSRYILLLHQPLKLYYRIIIYQGEKPDVEFLNVAWDVYNLQ